MPVVPLDYIGLGKFRVKEAVSYRGVDVPEGFVTDLASIPRLFWPLLPANGWYELAAVFHDRLCVELAEGVCGLSSREVDRLFRVMARENAIDNPIGAWIVSWILWTGVRWGALLNPSRRDGWWRDGWLALAITAILLLMSIVAVRRLDSLVHAVF